MNLWDTIATVDSELSPNTCRIVFVNTALLGKLKLLIFTTGHKLAYTGELMYTQGCSYLCFCNIPDISYIQTTVYTQQGENGPYTMYDFYSEYYNNSIVNVSLYAENCTPMDDWLVMESSRAETLHTRGIAEQLKFQCRNEPSTTFRFMYTPVVTTNCTNRVQLWSCSNPAKHGKLFDYRQPE